MKPDFKDIKNSEEFLQHYWYAAELRDICSKNNLPTLGTKAELMEYIIAHLNGEKPAALRKKSNKKRSRRAVQIK